MVHQKMSFHDLGHLIPVGAKNYFGPTGEISRALLFQKGLQRASALVPHKVTDVVPRGVTFNDLSMGCFSGKSIYILNS